MEKLPTKHTKHTKNMKDVGADRALIFRVLRVFRWLK